MQLKYLFRQPSAAFLDPAAYHQLACDLGNYEIQPRAMITTLRVFIKPDTLIPFPL